MCDLVLLCVLYYMCVVVPQDAKRRVVDLPQVDFAEPALLHAAVLGSTEPLGAKVRVGLCDNEARGATDYTHFCLHIALVCEPMLHARLRYAIHVI